MANVRYRGHTIELAGGETVLEGLERAGLEPRASCRAGACQACLLRAKTGAVPARAQEGLKAAWREQGLFLACQAVPTEDLDVIEPEGAAHEVEATLVERARVSGDVARLVLAPRASFPYRAGQFAHVARPGEATSRSYSLASVPSGSGLLELHVRRIEGGLLSPWLVDEAPLGAPVVVRGPFGDCVYEPGNAAQPLVLAGTSTGLAPLLGVVRDALAQGHEGPIRLYHGSLKPAGLYLGEELSALAAAHANLTVQRCVLDAEGQPDLREAALDDALIADGLPLKSARIYLCGAPDLVQRLKKKLFLAGATLKEIRSDPFVPAPALP